MRALPRVLALPTAALLGLTLLSTAPSGTAVAVGGQVVTAVSAAPDPALRRKAGARRIDLTRWDLPGELRSGRLAGAAVQDGRVVLTDPVVTRTQAGRRYDAARWLSPWTTPGFVFDELIPSWSARTPKGSWITVQVRGRTTQGRRDSQTSWDTIADWASGDKHVQRRSLSGQSDDGTTVNVDTWRTSGLASYQIRVLLKRRSDSHATPSLEMAAAMTSRVPDTAGRTSKPGPGKGVVLDVPRYSQMVHAGHYPQWGGGGEAWCSPTSTSMVLGYYDALPLKRRYRWVPTDHTDPWVDYAARATYDHAYEGTGNWPFNTAYAAPRAGDAFVTRLRSLREAERFIAAGIPLVVSIAFGSGELSGAPISSSNGHLLVIAGFRKNGDVVVNDPAASTRGGVRRDYRRDQFEKVWREASGGLTYVITDDEHPLPGRSPGNW